MKNLIFVFCAVCFIQSTTSGQSSWKSPDYKPEAYRKVMVLAKFTDELAKRKVEDATVKLLNDAGISAIQAYSAITADDIATYEKFMAKADEFQIDALVVYTVKGRSEEYKNTPSVNLNVGVPVHIGIFSGFLGTNVPLKGSTKTVKTVNVNAAFYNRSSKKMQWSFPLSIKIKGNIDKLANSFSKSTFDAMVKDQLFMEGR